MTARHLEPCEHCDGEGRVWKHADPTTGQSVECEVCVTPPQPTVDELKQGGECPTCLGEGELEHPHLMGAYGGSHAIDPPDPVMIECEDCRGTGKFIDLGEDA